MREQSNQLTVTHTRLSCRTKNRIYFKLSTEFVHRVYKSCSPPISADPPPSDLSRFSEHHNSSLQTQQTVKRCHTHTFTTAARNQLQSCYCLGFSGAGHTGALTTGAAGSSGSNILDLKQTPTFPGTEWHLDRTLTAIQQSSCLSR